MIPELGHFALIVALGLTIIQSLVPLWGAARNDAAMIAVARPAAYAQLLFVFLSYLALTYAFIVHDFSVAYVSHHSNLLQPISVGRPYFDSMFALIGAPLLLLLGFGPSMRWKSDDPARVRNQLQGMFILSLAIGMVLPFVIDGVLHISAGFGLAAALWVGITTVWAYIKRARSSSRVPLAFTGMTLAHLGVALFVAGVTMVMTYEKEKDLRMEPGQTYAMSGYEFKFLGTRKVQGPNYVADEGRIELYRKGKLIKELNPQKRIYNDQNNPMTEAAIDVGFMRDVYSALGEPLGNGAWSMRLYHKPLIRWIWLGCLLMTIGGVLAISDKRYRRSRVAQRQTQINVQVIVQS